MKNIILILILIILLIALIISLTSSFGPPAEFDKPIHYLAPYSSVTFIADSGITLNQTVYENNFLDIDNGVPKNPWKIRLQIDNSSGADGKIWRFVVYGKFVEETDSEAVHGSGNTIFEYENNVIDNLDWAGKLAQWLYEEFSYNRVLNVTVANFTKAIQYKIGDRLNVYDDTGIVTTYRIADMNIDAGKAKITLKLIKDRAEDFVYSGVNKRIIGVARRPWIDGRDLNDTIDLSDGAGGDGTTIKGGPDSKDMVSPSGIRQIYCISMVDQIDGSHTLDIPIYIPANAGGGDASGTARIKVKTVPFRAYATAASTATMSSGAVWSGTTDTISTVLGGSHTHTFSTTTGANGSHSHSVSINTGSAGAHTHTISDTTSTVSHAHGGATGIADGSAGDHYHDIASYSHDHDISATTSSDGSHSHSGSGSTDTVDDHQHSVDGETDESGSHTHQIELSDLSHSHDISHGHSLDYGIYEYSGSPTTDVYHVVGDVETQLNSSGIGLNSEWDYTNLDVANGDIISVRADDLVRIYVYIFVEYTLS